jgi:hypothetical protein
LSYLFLVRHFVRKNKGEGGNDGQALFWQKIAGRSFQLVLPPTAWFGEMQSGFRRLVSVHLPT